MDKDIDKIKKEIFNPEEENHKKLEQLFPGVIKDGTLDISALLDELGEYEVVDTEKYELSWAGKSKAKQIANTDIVGRTLKYIPEDSKNPDTTENLYIEGDNLEVLKLLRNSYYGQIKMIYIDPPYNTGNDFVYKDDFSISKEQSDKDEGETDSEGNRLIVNQKSSNRYHANWLNMMYPRLKVAKDLLRDDGVIFISIDDNEITNLRKLCDEIFDEENFVEQIVWKNKYGSGAFTKGFANVHEYMLVYSKSTITNIAAPLTDEQRATYRTKDSKYERRGGYITQPLATTSKDPRPNLVYPIIYKDKEVLPEKQWIWSKERYEEAYKNDEIVINESNGRTSVRMKQYLRDENGVERLGKPLSMLNGPFNQEGTKESTELLGKGIFDFPKPSSLVKYIISFFINDQIEADGIILDFFSGSATSAHAVMQLNAEDGGNRKFIMVQLPEICDEKSEAYKAGYKNICEIGKERIRRAGEKIKKELTDKQDGTLQLEGESIDPEKLDIGFKVFRVGDTNIRWNKENFDMKRTLEESAYSNKDHLDFMAGFKDIDIVYEIMLRHRDIPLSSKVELLKNIGSRTYIFSNTVVVCLEEKITSEIVDKISAIDPKPQKIIFRDSAFDDDISLKLNTLTRFDNQLKKNNQTKDQTYRVEFI